MQHILLAQALETAVNQVLKLEGDIETLMQPLVGRSLSVEVTDWRFKLLLVGKPQGFHVYVNAENQADVMLSGDLFALLSLVKSDQPQAILSGQKVSVSGDTSVLQAFSLFAKQLNLDWQQALSNIIGDIPAHLLSQPLKRALQYLQQNHQSHYQDLRDYLQQECRLLPCREEVEDFFEDIQQLRQDIDRLALKVECMATKG